MNTDRLKVWVRAMRVPFFTATVIPVLLGSLAAWHDTSLFSWQRFWLALAGAVLIHAGTNLANDYFDHVSGCDEANTNPTPFSGGSRVIQEGLISAKGILIMSMTCFLLGSIIGLYLNYISGENIILILGAIGVFLGIFYSARPFRIGYGSFGELAVGFGFGPLMVMGAYYVQAQNLSFKVFLISVPLGILIALVLFINEFPDYSADKTVGKRTLVVILGKKRAVALYRALLISVYAVLVGLVIAKVLPYLSLVALVTLPVALKALVISRVNYGRIYELLPANAATIKLHSAIGLLLCAGIALDKIFIIWR